MVGGIVIGITRSEGRVHVNVADCPHYPKHGRGDECPRPDTCCVYVEERKCINRKREQLGDTIEIKVGDSLWWQSGMCYWTPKENKGRQNNKCGVDFDIPIPKLGYSH